VTRSALLVCAAFCTWLIGCAGFLHRPPPDLATVPETWRPADVFRAQIRRFDAGEIVVDDRDGLSPDEAAIMAIDRNLRLRAARAERGIGGAEVLAAGVLPNPRLDSSLSFPVSGSEATVLGYGAGIAWNVTPLVARGSRVLAAQESASSIDVSIAWKEWQVAQAARLHAIRAVYLTRQIQIAREFEQMWQQRVDALERARAANAVTEMELINAARSLADARMSRLESQRHLVVERAALNRAIGADASRQMALDDSFHPADASPKRDVLLAGLTRRRLDLIALQHAHRSDDEAIRAAVLAQFPPVEIGFGISREVDRVGSAGISLSFELPFFDRNQAPVARQRARRVQIEAEYDARLNEARTDVRRALGEIDIVKEQLIAAADASQTASRLADAAHTAAVSGALSPLIAANTLELSYASRIRALQVEKALAELEVALALASGVYVR